MPWIKQLQLQWPHWVLNCTVISQWGSYVYFHKYFPPSFHCGMKLLYCLWEKCVEIFYRVKELPMFLFVFKWFREPSIGSRSVFLPLLLRLPWRASELVGVIYNYNFVIFTISCQETTCYYPSLPPNAMESRLEQEGRQTVLEPREVPLPWEVLGKLQGRHDGCPGHSCLCEVSWFPIFFCYGQYLFT